VNCVLRLLVVNWYGSKNTTDLLLARALRMADILKNSVP